MDGGILMGSRQGWREPIIELLIAAVIVMVVWSQLVLKRDAFGVDALYPDIPNGMSWHAEWSGGEYVWSDDPWVALGSGDVRYRADGGVLSISGATSRLYVRDPEGARQWGDIEVTIYARRTDDAGVPYSGIVTEVRTNHGMTGSLEDAPCDTRALSARLRFDGTADFGKETKHPTTIATDPVLVFPGGMPYNEWIGYKHVVHDIDNGAGTHQELWMDLTGGAHGGDWELVATHDDHVGDGFGEVACAPGIDPALPLVKGPRTGSESGLPNLSVLFRADDIGFNGLEYRSASIREIVAPL